MPGILPFFALIASPAHLLETLPHEDDPDCCNGQLPGSDGQLPGCNPFSWCHVELPSAPRIRQLCISLTACSTDSMILV